MEGPSRALVCGLQLSEGDGELELVLRVGGDGEGLLLEALCLQEARDPVVLVLGHLGEHRGRRLEVPPHDRRLVLEHGEEELVRD